MKKGFPIFSENLFCFICKTFFEKKVLHSKKLQAKNFFHKLGFRFFKKRRKEAPTVFTKQFCEVN